jgi:hypothetical protein
LNHFAPCILASTLVPKDSDFTLTEDCKIVGGCVERTELQGVTTDKPMLYGGSVSQSLARTNNITVTGIKTNGGEILLDMGYSTQTGSNGTAGTASITCGQVNKANCKTNCTIQLYAYYLPYGSPTEMSCGDQKQVPVSGKVPQGSKAKIVVTYA